MTTTTIDDYITFVLNHLINRALCVFYNNLLDGKVKIIPTHPKNIYLCICKDLFLAYLFFSVDIGLQTEKYLKNTFFSSAFSFLLNFYSAVNLIRFWLALSRLSLFCVGIRFLYASPKFYNNYYLVNIKYLRDMRTNS